MGVNSEAERQNKRKILALRNVAFRLGKILHSRFLVSFLSRKNSIFSFAKTAFIKKPPNWFSADEQNPGNTTKAEDSGYAGFGAGLV